MAIASIVIGIFLIIGGVSCMAAPIETFLSYQYLLAIMLLVYGIFGIIRFFKRRALVSEFIVSILAVIIGFVYIFRPGDTPPAGNIIGLDRFVLFVIAAWFLIKGCIDVVMSIKTRYVNNHWILGLIVGLLSFILGIYSFAQPAYAAVAAGTLIGFYFIECGLDMLVLGTTVGIIKSSVNDIDKSVNSTIDEIKTDARDSADGLRGSADADAAVDAVADAAADAEENTVKPE